MRGNARLQDLGAFGERRCGAVTRPQNRRHAPANVPYTSDGFVSIHDTMAVACQRFDLVLQFPGPLVIAASLGGSPFDMQLPQAMIHLEKQGAFLGCEHVAPP